MIIFISDSIADSIIQKKKLPEIQNCLFHLADEYRRGTHIILGDRKTFRTIIDHTEILTDDLRKVFLAIYYDLTTISALFSLCSEYMEITSREDTKRITNKDSKKVYIIPVELISTTRYINEHFLLCENQNDCHFYKSLFNFYIINNKIPENFLVYRGNNHGGGGDSISDEYQEIQNNGQFFCLCIVDSDQRYPPCMNNNIPNYGRTASRIIKADDEKEIQTQYKILDVREIENLIPFFYLEQVISTQDDRYSGLISLKQIINSDCKEAIMYFDFKDGIKGFEVLNCEKDSKPNPYSIYWQKIISTLNISNKCNIDCDKSTCSKSSCKFFLLEGIKDKVLNKFITWVNEENNIESLINNIDDYNYPQWIQLSKLIFSWFCGLKSKKTLGVPESR